MTHSNIAIIGAGISGLSCARRLIALGSRADRVTLFDKARGPGGRMSSRRHPASTFDHGAQYFTARDPRFERALEDWRDARVVATWQGRFARLTPDGLEPELPSISRYVGTPRMSALTRHLARGLSLRTQTRIDHIEGSAHDWRLVDTRDNTHGPFTHVVITAPGPQSAAILDATAPALAELARQPEYAPCWALMLVPEARLKTRWDALRVTDPDAAIAWAARNTSKPGRGAGDAWTLHAGHVWSRAHLEDPAGQVADALCQAFSRLCGAEIQAAQATHVQAMRWRYALATPAEGHTGRFHADEALGLVLAGDGFSGGRVEDAWLSGLEAGEALAG